MASDAPLTSASEALRLEALRSLNQLPHAVPCPALDALVETAAAVCDVPIALVTLVDEHEQFFKACMGLGIAGTPREISFCTHAIEQPDIYEVCDATESDLFASNPLVTGADNIRFYAGAPGAGPVVERGLPDFFFGQNSVYLNPHPSSQSQTSPPQRHTSK